MSSGTEQHFDLAVVGAGIAGLSAAYYWLAEVDPDASIIVVEHGAQLGGPSIQCSFDVDGHRLLSPGGAQELVFPSAFPSAVRTALADLGIDVDRFYEDCDSDHYRRHGAVGEGISFASDVWGQSHLVTYATRDTADFGAAPVAQRARSELSAMLAAPTDWLAGRSDEQKLAELRTRSCEQLLRDFAELHEDSHHFLRYSTSPHSGMTFDQHPALDATLVGYLGLDGLGIEASGDPWDGLTHTGRRFFPHMDPPIFRFPDGNATVARALAHRLVPDLFSSGTVDERLTEEMATHVLDRPDNQVRIQLGATVTSVTHDTDGTVGVRVGRPDGATTTLRARAAIVATSATDAAQAIPELDPGQRSTATALGRYPIVSATIAFRNWRAWQTLGISRLSWPGHPTWQQAGLEFPVRIGTIAPSPNPDAPITATALGGLSAAGEVPASGATVGRERLVAATARDQITAELWTLLTEALAPAGFKPERDIADASIELWPQGYARCSTSLDVPGDGSAAPTARRRLASGVGRIAIANVDVIDHPFLDGAMESAHIAVTHLGAKA